MPTERPLPLSTLIATQDGVQVGDKVFGQFAATGGFTTALTSQVQVTGITAGGQNGVDLTFPVNITIAPVFGPSFQGDVSFQASVTGSGLLLHDIAGLLTTTPTGGDQQVLDTASAGTVTLGTGFLEDNSGGIHSIPQLSYGITFRQNVSMASISRAFTFFGLASGTLDTSMTFSQTAVVPEPTTSSLMIAGLIAAAIMGRGEACLYGSGASVALLGSLGVSSPPRQGRGVDP